jgi:3-oxoacyl-[acyl-carrier protein] reductase
VPDPGRPWAAAELDARLGGYFADRDPGRTFACTDVLTLS